MAYVFQTFGKDGEPHERWRYRYVDRFGRRRIATGTTTKRDTKDLAEEVELREKKIRLGQIPPPRESSKPREYEPTVKEYLAAERVDGGLRGHGWSKTHANKVSKLLEWWKKRLGLRQIRDIDLLSVKRELNRLRTKGRANKTLQNKAEPLKAFCNWCVERGYLDETPLKGLAKIDATPRTPYRPFTDEERLALLEAAPSHRQLIYRVALATGYRQSELRALKTKDLDVFGPSLPLAAEFTKNRREARQPISRELANELAALAEGRDPEERLLPRMVDVDGTRDNFERDLKKAALWPRRVTPEGRLGFHSFRVNFINAVVASGADLKTIMELARHGSAFMSMQTYAKPNRDAMRKAAEAAERVNLGTIRAQRPVVAVAGSALTTYGDETSSWHTRRDSNPQPSVPKTDALSN